MKNDVTQPSVAAPIVFVSFCVSFKNRITCFVPTIICDKHLPVDDLLIGNLQYIHETCRFLCN